MYQHPAIIRLCGNRHVTGLSHVGCLCELVGGGQELNQTTMCSKAVYVFETSAVPRHPIYRGGGRRWGGGTVYC